MKSSAGESGFARSQAPGGDASRHARARQPARQLDPIRLRAQDASVSLASHACELSVERDAVTRVVMTRDHNHGALYNALT